MGMFVQGHAHDQSDIVECYPAKTYDPTNKFQQQKVRTKINVVQNDLFLEATVRSVLSYMTELGVAHRIVIYLHELCRI